MAYAICELLLGKASKDETFILVRDTHIDLALFCLIPQKAAANAVLP